MFAVRTMASADAADAVALQFMCFPPPFPAELLWTEEQLHSHMAIFPEGQWVARLSAPPGQAEGPLVGTASSLLISESAWLSHRTWDETVGGHHFTRHDPIGDTLFGADISVHPAWRLKGVGRALYRARYDLVKSMNLTRYGTACRLPGFSSWCAKNLHGTVEDYCLEVVDDKVKDPSLTPLLSFDLRFLGVIHGHMDDEESGNAAAILEWRP